MNSEETRPNQRKRVRTRAAVNLCLSPHPAEQPAERRLPSLSSPPDPQRSAPVGAAAARHEAGGAGRPAQVSAAPKDGAAPPAEPSAGPGEGPVGRGRGPGSRHPLSTWACGRTAAPRGRDSPEAAGAERGSRTLGSRRDSAPGGGGGGEGWGGRPGTDKGARKRALRLRAARRPASRRGLRVRRAAGAGGRSAPARREGRRNVGCARTVPAPHTKRRLGGRRVRGEVLGSVTWCRGSWESGVRGLVGVRGEAVEPGVHQGRQVEISA